MNASYFGSPDVDTLTRYVPSGGIAGNVLLICAGFKISYNADPGMGMNFFAGDFGGDETAILAEGKFFILNGDFRREYAEAADKGGLNACLMYFASKPDLISSWSASIEEAMSMLKGGEA